MTLTIQSQSVPYLAAHACLQEMLSSERFDICSVRTAAAAVGKKIAPEVETILRAVHCLYWTSLADPVKDYILGVCTALLEP